MPFTPAHGTCDCCGKPISEYHSASLTIRGPKQDYRTGNMLCGEILFDWRTEGAYCMGCLYGLIDEIIDKLEIPDRYERDEDTLAHEIEIIKRRKNEL